MLNEIRHAALSMAIEYHSRTLLNQTPSPSEVISTALMFEKYLLDRDTDKGSVSVDHDNFPYDPDKKDFAFR